MSLEYCVPFRDGVPLLPIHGRHFDYLVLVLSENEIELSSVRTVQVHDLGDEIVFHVRQGPPTHATDVDFTVDFTV